MSKSIVFFFVALAALDFVTDQAKAQQTFYYGPDGAPIGRSYTPPPIPAGPYGNAVPWIPDSSGNMPNQQSNSYYGNGYGHHTCISAGC